MSYAILRDGSLGILATSVDLRREWRFSEDGELVGRPFELASTAEAQFFIFDGERLTSEATFPLRYPFIAFDRFPDGRWLAAGARASEMGNARLLASDGKELGRVHIGDGIMHVKIDEAGLIWVGWFDEGVFGNDGWKVEGHEWPPSSYGLAAFDAEGNLVAYARDAPPHEHIADCYALNVIGNTAWACTDTDFSILRCSASEGSKWWLSKLSGVRALAVQMPHVLAAGGYSEDSNKVVLVKLGKDGAMSIQEWRLPFQAGYPHRVDFIDGRNTELHIVNDGTWYRWQIDDFLADAGVFDSN